MEEGRDKKVDATHHTPLHSPLLPALVMMDYLILQAVNDACPHGDGMMVHQDARNSIMAATGRRASKHRRMPPFLFGESALPFMHATKHRRSSPVFDDSSFMLIIQLLIEPELFSLLNRMMTKSRIQTTNTTSSKRSCPVKQSHGTPYAKHGSCNALFGE
jgi:hypothetical protein